MDQGTKSGTIGGTLLTVIANIRSEDVIKTAALAAIGATISFFVSLGLRYLVRWIRK